MRSDDSDQQNLARGITAFVRGMEGGFSGSEAPDPSAAPTGEEQLILTPHCQCCFKLSLSA